MTTNLNRSESKTRDRHSSDPIRRSSRPAADGSRSADEIRESVKETVGKGVSAVAGAVEGIDETMQETHLADTAESAIHQVGETATKVVRATKEETDNLKSALHGEGSGPGAEEEDDASTERDDPTFSAVSSYSSTSSFGSGATESSSSGSPLTSSSEDDEDEQPGL